MQEEKDRHLVILVDALNLFTRHFVAHPAVSSNGEHVGGIVGFLYAVIDLAERYRPAQMIVVWEGGGSTRRRNLFKDYKSRRRPERLNRYYDDDIPDTIENRNHQISTLVNIIKDLPIEQLYIPDCEADDVIGYLNKYRLRDCRKLIISSDKDFYQLLDKKTIIYSPTWKKLVTEKEVKEKFKISPRNFCLAKSICGDPSDNISGVKGVGFKTLAKRFPELLSDEDIMISDIIAVAKQNISEGSKIKAFERIAESESLIRRNWKLIYLDTSNLSEFQISKIVNSVDTFSDSRNKINVMRTLIKEGIQTFNVDRMFLSMNHMGKKNV